jgi:hypothetical protein
MFGQCFGEDANEVYDPLQEEGGKEEEDDSMDEEVEDEDGFVVVTPKGRSDGSYAAHGWLKKQSTDFSFRWHWRYFALDGTSLKVES